MILLPASYNKITQYKCNFHKMFGINYKAIPETIHFLTAKALVPSGNTKFTENFNFENFRELRGKNYFSRL